MLKQIGMKNRFRHYVAVSFLLVAFIEMGSHAIMDNHDAFMSEHTGNCQFSETLPPSVDCKDGRRSRRPQSNNLLDELMHHSVLLNSWNVLQNGPVYRAAAIESSGFRLVSRPLEPPFNPPKHA